jgi:hypothetical protein
MSTQITAWNLKLDERNHVEKPLLDQLASKPWVTVLLNYTEVGA